MLTLTLMTTQSVLFCVALHCTALQYVVLYHNVLLSASTVLLVLHCIVSLAVWQGGPLH